MKNTRGFTIVEGLLILIIVGIIGAAGYFVWHTKHQSTKNINTAQNSSNTAKAQPANKSSSSSTADWITFNSTQEGFSVKYPKGWFTGGDETYCLGILFIGPTRATGGDCKNGKLGEIFIASEAGNQVADSELTPYSDYDNFQKTNVTVDGVSGLKETGSAKNDISSEDGNISIAKGTKIIVYLLFTNNKTYTASYIQAPNEPDASNDFNNMITQTLKFSS